MLWCVNELEISGHPDAMHRFVSYFRESFVRPRRWCQLHHKLSPMMAPFLGRRGCMLHNPRFAYGRTFRIQFLSKSLNFYDGRECGAIAKHFPGLGITYRASESVHGWVLQIRMRDGRVVSRVQRPIDAAKQPRFPIEWRAH